MPTLTPEAFVAKWANSQLKETAAYTSHFDDVCRLLGHPTPAEQDPAGEFFTYQPAVTKTTGSGGFADVWYKGRFAVEYKGKGKSLREAYLQLLGYREALLNPPLLIVCDFDHWEIHTNFQNTDPVVYRFSNADLLNPETRRLLAYAFYTPNRLKPGLNSEAVTQQAAGHFVRIVDAMRGRHATPDEIARFLTRLIFCLFAEDIDLLPTGPGGEIGVFSEVVDKTFLRPDQFAGSLRGLFAAMREGGMFGMTPIPWINGALFEADGVIRLTAEALGRLREATLVDWSRVEPSVFGTMFEQVLDPGKRKQLGTHYTSRADIELVVEPVLMRPLRRQWEAARLAARPFRAEMEKAVTEKARRAARAELAAVRDRMLDAVRGVTVLDPACGSGNFLYVSLLSLMDLERDILDDPLWDGLPRPQPGVHPRQLYGIEKDPIAHALASIVVWIGYLQWHYQHGERVQHRPVLEDLHGHILNMDAILQFDADGRPFEPEWPKADVIVGNPPFLGDKKMRAELGDEYVDALRGLYKGRVPGGADLVTYWFEKARAQIEAGNAQRAGLLATNSIRGGANREVLKRIKATGDIFMAWSDQPWILDGAAVRVSIVGFAGNPDVGARCIVPLPPEPPMLDGQPVATINADLTGTEADITGAVPLPENGNLSFIGVSQHGPFEISSETALAILQANPRNAAVVRTLVNSEEVMHRPQHRQVIDFAPGLSLTEAETFSEPMDYVRTHVKPIRDKNNRAQYRNNWWIHGEARPAMREAIQVLVRYLVTPRVAKHRVVVWFNPIDLPSDAVVAIARSDDYFFGVLHSFVHEWWSLRMGTSLEDRPRYTPTTTFETFPFPWPPGHEDTASPHYAAISAAAAALHAERDAWLNPPGVTDERALKRRTLTNLYNALVKYRTSPPGSLSEKREGEQNGAAEAFAPRLAELHDALDRAVLDAYGWGDLADSLRTDAGKDELLRRLLALNGERAHRRA